MKPTLNPITPSTHPTDHPSFRPYLKPSPPTLKIPQSKAWCRLHRANATSPRAAHCIANSPQPRRTRSSASACASRASQRTARMQPARAQRIASQTIRAPCSAPPAPITSPPRIARSARRTPRTCSSARASQYFALVYLVRGTNFSKIQFKYIAN
jgi:hypothetical protein